MASQFPRDRAVSMVERAKRLLLTPKAEWPAIDAEPMTVRQVFTGWAVPLAAIGPIAGLIGGLVFGYGAFGISFRPTMASAIGTALVSYALALLSVWVMSLIVDALAPQFGGTKDRIAATKVAVFSMTAAWLAGIFQLIPALGILGIVGLYSLYLLYLGLPRLMRAPEDKALPYTAVVIVAGIAIFLVIGALTTALTSRLFMPSYDAGSVSGEVTVPGVGSVDLAKLDAATKQMAAASAKMEADAKSGTPSSLTPTEALQAMLPATVAGWQRGDVETQSAGAGGIGGSSAKAAYSSGSDTIALTIADIGAMGALAGIGGALNVQSNKTTANGYERTSTAGGRITNEKWDSAGRRGEYNIIVGNRFSVSADGNAPDDGAFKALVGGVDLARLEAMAKE